MYRQLQYVIDQPNRRAFPNCEKWGKLISDETTFLVVALPIGEVSLLNMQELRWQDRPVTYGCLVRLFFISATILLIAVATAILILNIGGTFWSTSSSAILLGLGVLFGFPQWRFPLSPSTSMRCEMGPVERLETI